MMFANFHPIRDLILSFVLVIGLAVAAWITVDYGAALIVAIGGFTLLALLAFPLVAIYEEEHDLPFNRRP